MNLTDKVAIVTGASSGIGEATARALAKHGMNVVATARREDRLHKLVDEIKADGGEATALHVDITDEEQTQAMVARTVETYGGLHALINNAGVMLLNPMKKAQLSEWRTMFEVNVMGLMAATHFALPYMMEEDESHLIMVSSVAGRRVGGAYGAVYSATKYAVNAFSEGVRKDYAADGVRVTLIEPGIVTTELQSHIPDPDIKGLIDQRISGGMRPLVSEDIAEAIIYALSQPGHVNINELLIMPTDQV